MVNGEVVEKKSRELNSGDIIQLLGNELRWEFRAEAKRMISYNRSIPFL